MVTEEDLIRTVAAAYSHGWRQVKLYFMCGLPTETDEDVLEIADLAKQGDRQGPRGHRPQRHPLHGLDRRLRAQAAHAVPVGRPARPRDDRRAAAQAARRRSAPTSSYGRAIGFRYHDGKPGIIEGLLSRGDRRVGRGHRGGLARRRPVRRLERALLLRPLGGGRRAAALAGTGVDLDWYTTRERDYDEVLPWDHLDSGLDKDWLWADWEDALDRAGRGRGLPLDALLRLRRLPGDGHRDPDRPHGARSCCRSPWCSGRCCTSATASGAPGWRSGTGSRRRHRHPTRCRPRGR